MRIVQRPRSHLVTLRLTPDEYARIKQATIDSGAVSLSDFTRRIVLKEIDASPGAILNRDLGTIVAGLRDIQETIARVLGDNR